MSSSTGNKHTGIALRPSTDAVLHPRLHARPVFPPCDVQPDATPLTAPRRLQPECLCPPSSGQLSGLGHIFHQEVGSSWRLLSQRVCAEAGQEISSLPEERVRFKRLKLRRNLHPLCGSAGLIWIKVWVCPPPPPPPFSVLSQLPHEILQCSSCPTFVSPPHFISVSFTSSLKSALSIALWWLLAQRSTKVGAHGVSFCSLVALLASFVGISGGCSLPSPASCLLLSSCRSTALLTFNRRKYSAS